MSKINILLIILIINNSLELIMPDAANGGSMTTPNKYVEDTI